MIVQLLVCLQVYYFVSSTFAYCGILEITELSIEKLGKGNLGWVHYNEQKWVN